ncbi:MAG TPA: CrcB family protein [Streptosporangiaceae bacterium]|jgi:CrcB protein
MAASSAFGGRVRLLAAIGAGGALGAAARYGTELAIPPKSGVYPVATFLVNIVGAVILGAITALPSGWLAQHDLTKPGIGTGFCGGLTTFSTMSLEIYQRLPGHSGLAVGYAAASLIAAPACAWAGYALVQAARSGGPGSRRAPPARASSGRP